MPGSRATIAVPKFKDESLSTQRVDLTVPDALSTEMWSESFPHRLPFWVVNAEHCEEVVQTMRREELHPKVIPFKVLPDNHVPPVFVLQTVACETHCDAAALGMAIHSSDGSAASQGDSSVMSSTELGAYGTRHLI